MLSVQCFVHNGILSVKPQFLKAAEIGVRIWLTCNLGDCPAITGRVVSGYIYRLMWTGSGADCSRDGDVFVCIAVFSSFYPRHSDAIAEDHSLRIMHSHRVIVQIFRIVL